VESVEQNPKAISYSMIKLSSINGLLTSIFLLMSFGTTNLMAQELNHQLGVVLVQLNERVKIETIINEVQYFQGEKTEIQLLKPVSEPFHIWSLKFDYNQINELDFLKFIRRQPLIKNAQFDFWLENRTQPNDPFYFFQYFLKNYGQTGGTPGVDLDAEIAWQTTTGGVTSNGDTVVVCIIDEGFEITHEDLYGNLWINHDEIPDNGIDDDENGYIDDYYGWNVVDSTDDVGNGNDPGTHGTRVAGIAGAVGNNGTGISGLNWNIKMMYVTRGFSNSDAIAAYTYAFQSRKKYNESNGNEGAFVVATNTSWGVNFGMPDDAPLWCAIYDSLGTVGVLNAAATANLDINVDEEGDLPTTCTSDFLVTTTKVDNNDELPPNTGYGPISIDLAAFGKNVFTTEINNEYGVLSGTSAAAPQVAGAIALLYSAPCPSFIALAKSQPESAGLLVKEYILNGAEDIESLEDITLSGGRLNVANSLQLLMDDCNYTGCYPPYSIVIDDITGESASIVWLTGVTTNTVNIRYRVVGESNWIYLSNISNPFVFSNLESCTNYEFQLSSGCGPLTSDYSLSYEFQTSACCNPPTMFTATFADKNNVFLEWNEVPFADLYSIRYRELNTPDWETIYMNGLEAVVPDLNSCTSYEFQIQSHCLNGLTSDFSESLLVTTFGCSNCIELPYCQSSASDMSFIWIKKVSLSNLDNITGNSINGYSNHTDQSADLIQGQSYEIILQSESELDSFPAIFNVWIDFDQNGIFDDFNELILHSSSPEISATKIIYIPTEALLGSTRMRVSFLEQNYGPCGDSFLIGEIEDYCINIDEAMECLPPVSINFSSYQNAIEIDWLGSLNESYVVKYKEIVDTLWSFATNQSNEIVINDLVECTDYEFIIQSVCEGEPSTPTEVFYFTTKGCGACLDYDYCSSNSADVSFEWIDRVQLSSLDNHSGPNSGFAYFQDYSANLIIGKHYPLVITPGFSSVPYEEYYMVWIDLNHDGFFDSNEIIYDSYYTSSQSSVGIITIPETALLGSTRMRVFMKYLVAPNAPCENEFFGEIEEYCVNIVESDDSVCDQPENVEIDSTAQYSAFVNWQAVNNAVSYMVRYQSADSTNAWKYITTNNNDCELFGLEECSSFQIQVKTICELGLSDFSDIKEFETSCLVSSNNVENQGFSSINLFPNPTLDHFFVSYYLNTFSEVQLELYDVTGKILTNKKAPTAIGDQQIEIKFPEGCAEGIYFLKMKTKAQSPTILKVLKISAQ
jgi:subtilisin family serine protease